MIKLIIYTTVLLCVKNATIWCIADSCM